MHNRGFIHFLIEQIVLYLVAGLLGVVALFLINRNSSALVGQWVPHSLIPRSSLPRNETEVYKHSLISRPSLPGNETEVYRHSLIPRPSLPGNETEVYRHSLVPSFDIAHFAGLIKTLPINFYVFFFRLFVCLFVCFFPSLVLISWGSLQHWLIFHACRSIPPERLKEIIALLESDIMIRYIHAL